MAKTKIKRSIQLAIVILAVFVFLGAGDQAARFNSLGHHLMCMCGCNQVLLECNHVGCQYSDRMRGELVEAIERGDNDSLAMQDFVQKYGTTVLLAPSTSGFGSVAWITPYAALVIGIGAVVLIVRSWNGRPLAAAGADAPDAQSDLNSYRDQIRRETEL